MELSDAQNYAIQARVASVLGASTYDRVFSGISFTRIDGPLLFAASRNEVTAAEIENDFSLLIADIASKILRQKVRVVVVIPKVLH